ncbi:MAG TPA: N-acyl homoserine lactonase family protein [Gammaproteobacteria bacterium]|nr:N-acyl homoserine lactonase family protein [Gammaproteobacteria bacterium]
MTIPPAFRFFRILAFLLAASAPAQGNPASEALATPRLYALDCGTLKLDSMALFEDTDEYANTPGTMAVPCFLIRHPNGDLIWDTGLGDRLAQHKDGVAIAEGITARVPVTLQAQLQQLGLAPEDIELVAFSHLHVDHTGNASLFTKALYLLNRKDLDWALGKPTPFGVDAESLSFASTAKTQAIELDHDVFGDGSVRIMSTPGHTPGHQILLLRLANTGTIILSGDLYHTRDNFRLVRIPAINHSRGETLASFDRVERLIRKHGARLVIQHAPEDFAELPKFSAYLD